jgi:hypothetical protein
VVSIWEGGFEGVVLNNDWFWKPIYANGKHIEYLKKISYSLTKMVCHSLNRESWWHTRRFLFLVRIYFFPGTSACKQIAERSI